MTTDAIVPDPFELKRIPRRMTFRTTQVPMRSHQRKSVLLVYLRNSIDDPIIRCMAAYTIISNGHGMHIRMARSTIRRGHIEDQRGVTGLAVDRIVRTAEGE